MIVGVKYEHEQAKRLIVEGITDLHTIVCRTGLDWNTAEQYLNQWKLWKQNEIVSPLRIKN